MGFFVNTPKTLVLFVIITIFILSFIFYFTISCVFCVFIQYIDKPPRGKHSTKGLGKKVPLESEYVTWKDEVVVPCGKPVASKVKASELMYNEYIVYNAAQVSMFQS